MSEIVGKESKDDVQFDPLDAFETCATLVNIASHLRRSHNGTSSACIVIFSMYIYVQIYGLTPSMYCLQNYSSLSPRRLHAGIKIFWTSRPVNSSVLKNANFTVRLCRS